jgi:ABC-2 type transport system ATP-binding protein
MDQLVLEIEGISRSFGSIAAVRAISFQARAGDVIGLLGPNGAGKTTTIRVLSTILEPTGGRFSVNGIPQSKPLEIRRSIGVLPESSGYPLQWTGQEFLSYHARLFGCSPGQAKSRASDILAEVGLADRAPSRIGTYSRGMRQRLGVARALINEPHVVFLDEPTLGLDPAGQRQMMQLIREIASQRGAAVILSTHFLDEVEEVCSRILIMNRGEVIADGTVDEVKRRAAPRTLRVEVAAGDQDLAAAALRQLDADMRSRRSLRNQTGSPSGSMRAHQARMSRIRTERYGR